MKRVPTVLACLTIVTITVTACGSDDDNDNDSETPLGTGVIIDGDVEPGVDTNIEQDSNLNFDPDEN